MSLATPAPTKSKRIGSFLRRLREDEAGNTLLILAGGVFPILAMIGGAVDISRQYMTQARLQLACDAGALAARRVMANPTVLTTSDQATGNRFFDFNFPTGSFGTSGLTRSYVKGSADGTVNGTASAIVPTTVMAIFGIEQTAVGATCRSTLNVPNSDVMFVLDVTGSMSQTTSDGITKIAGLRQAVKDFYTALGPGSPSTGRIRYGFVPYSSAVNVGYLLPQTALVGKNPGDTWQYQSREVIFNDTYRSTTPSATARPSGTTTYTQAPTSYTTVSADLTVSGTTYARIRTSANTLALCTAVTVPFSSLILSGGLTTSFTGTTTRTYRISQNYAANGTVYHYNWVSNQCQLQYGRVPAAGTRTVAHVTTLVIPTWTPSYTFSKWTYKPRTVDVTGFVGGAAVPNPTYHVTSPNDSQSVAAPTTTTWAGCVEETATVNTITASSSLAIPFDAWDLKIDHVPTASAPQFRWRPLWPDAQYWRATDATYDGSLSNATRAESDFGTRISRFVSDGFGACPARARKLNSYTAPSASPTEDSALSSFNTYVDSLSPIGGTYHDIGMVWGARLLSPDGLFGSENTNAPNGFPINRHIIFMSDGLADARRFNYDSWGMNYWDGRVSGTSDSDTTMTAAHNRRFEMICNAAKAKGYTIWVVGFGISALPSQMSGCASDGDHATLSNSASSLSQQFQAIAQSIGGLRLTQ